MRRLIPSFFLKNQPLLVWILFALMLGGAVWLHLSLWNSPTKGEDIEYLYQDGKRIAQGENPYSRIHEGNMRENRKYSTYLPLFYLSSAVSQKLGLSEYEAWISFWKIILLFFTTGAGILIFFLFIKKNLILGGFLFSGFWLFNRWTLHLTKISQIDGIALFFLLLALAFFHEKLFLAFFCLGISLAVKQMAIFALPLFFLVTKRFDKKTILVSVLFLALIPFITSLPFLIWDFSGFIKSILFSATRYSTDHFGVPSADSLLGLVGLPAKIPLFLGLIGIWYLGYRQKLQLTESVFLVFVLLTDFNSVLFRQYLVWPVATLSLAALSWIHGKKQSS